jgi:hypothetical protein
MTIEYDPMGNLLPQGDYEFYVVHASEGQTRNGKPMLKMAYEVYDSKGGKHEIRDFIVVVPSYIFKLKQLCDSVGVNFEKGSIDADQFVGLKGKLSLKQDYDEDYGAQNRVAKYLKMSENQKTAEKVAEVDHGDMDQDIPF